MSVRNILIVFQTKMLSLLTYPQYPKNLTYSNLIVYFMLFFKLLFYAYILCVYMFVIYIIGPCTSLTSHYILFNSSPFKKSRYKYSKGKDLKDGHASFMYLKKERRRCDQSITYLINHKLFDTMFNAINLIVIQKH